MLDGGTTEPQAVKAYSLLRVILNTAVKEDELIRHNPCHIPGYDRYHTRAAGGDRRPGARARRADAAPVLRAGDRRRLLRAPLGRTGRAAPIGCRPRGRYGPRSAQAGGAAQPDGVRLTQVGGGRRTVTLPSAARSALADHLDEYVGEESEALVLTGDKGAVLCSGNFRRAVGWAAALRAAGMPEGFHFHDLRHTGNNLAAATGASNRDLIHRMGHASMRAALIYQHANSERDREIADAMDRRIVKQAKRAAAPAKVSKPKGEAAKQNAAKEKPAAHKAAKGTKPKRPAREAASDGTAGATGTPMARKTKEG